MSSVRQADLEYVGHIVADRWVVTSLLGVGGMGTVYQAQDRATGEFVALKRLRPEFMRDDEVVRRFVREGKSAAQMVHPNVVTVREIGRDASDGSLFIVQEFLSGMDLRHRLQGGRRLSPRECVAIIAPVAQGLACAHSFGVVHRDIKPANIFLAMQHGGEVVPKVIDFGVSKILGPASDGMSMTRTGIAIGTPQYMSPEQLRGEKGIDERTDVWSLGVVLSLMLTGRHPFHAEDSAHVMLKIVTADPERVDVLAPNVSRRLADVVVRALAKDRHERFRSMNDFLGALAQCPTESDVVPGERAANTVVEDSDPRGAEHTVATGELYTAEPATVVDGVFRGDSSPSMPAPILPRRPSTPPPRAGGMLLPIGGVMLVIALVVLALAIWTRR